MSINNRFRIEVPWFDALLHNAEEIVRDYPVDVYDVHFLRQDPLTVRGNHFAWHIDNHGKKNTEIIYSIIVLLRKTRSRKEYGVSFFPEGSTYLFQNVADGVLFSSSLPHITVPGSGVCMKVAIFFSKQAK